MNQQELFFALICLHFLCDYPLQGDFIGKFKCRRAHGIGHDFVASKYPNDTRCAFITDYMHNSPSSDVIHCRKNWVEHTINVGVPWYHLMTAHSFIHGGAVALATGSILLGLMEVVFHFAIDVLKCEGKTGIDTDQFLHVFCKIAYIVILVMVGQI